jgi:hypothetical protein
MPVVSRPANLTCWLARRHLELLAELGRGRPARRRRRFRLRDGRGPGRSFRRSGALHDQGRLGLLRVDAGPTVATANSAASVLTERGAPDSVRQTTTSSTPCTSNRASVTVAVTEVPEDQTNQFGILRVTRRGNCYDSAVMDELLLVSRWGSPLDSRASGPQRWSLSTTSSCPTTSAVATRRWGRSVRQLSRKRGPLRSRGQAVHGIGPDQFSAQEGGRTTCRAAGGNSSHSRDRSGAWQEFAATSTPLQ